MQVNASGQSDVAGLPDNAAGFAKAIVRLRNKYAPNVLLGYHFSTWGTGNDIIYSDPADATVTSLGVRSGNFEKSLGAKFDIAFTDLADRDAAFKQISVRRRRQRPGTTPATTTGLRSTSVRS